MLFEIVFLSTSSIFIYFMEKRKNRIYQEMIREYENRNM
jgi:hypothetical protein